MQQGRKLALSLLLAASAIGVFGISDSFAACRQVFTNTTCSGIWPWQKCTNHFKTVCDAPSSSLIKPGAKPVISNTARPGVPNVAGGRLIGSDSAGIIGHDGSTMRR